ncbi:MAG: hypothetical protein ACUVXA_16635 [Candidatus Jordarchaeum sp.]|uniref:hypothetical protein n=1 Tax=Candidatus Jordarchaeum sp. TaxID=2823881 RepID=UPI0040495672
MVTEGFAVMKCPHCQENIGIYYTLSLEKEKGVIETGFICPNCGEQVVFKMNNILVEKFSGF